MSLSQPTWTQINPAPIVLPQGTTAGTVVFPVAFYNVPFLALAATVLANPANPIIEVGIYGLTATGFSYALSQATPDGTYGFTWNATALQPPPPGCCNPCGPFTPDPSRFPLTGQTGTVNLIPGNITGNVTFPTAFSVAPMVTGNVIKPSQGSSNIFCSISNITPTGFTYTLTFPPAAGYTLEWVAVNS